MTPAPVRTFRRRGRSLPPARIRTLDRSGRSLVTALRYPGLIMLLPKFIRLREEAKYTFLNSVGLSTFVSLYVLLWMQRLGLNSMRTGTISKVHTPIRSIDNIPHTTQYLTRAGARSNSGTTYFIPYTKSASTHEHIFLNCTRESTYTYS